MSENCHPHPRNLDSSELEQFLCLICDAYRLNIDAARPVFYNDPCLFVNCRRVLAFESDLFSGLTLTPSVQNIRGAKIPVVELAGIATARRHQRRGYATQLIGDSIAHAGKIYGSALAYLVTDVPEVYETHGWVISGRVNDCIVELSSEESKSPEDIRVAIMSQPSEAQLNEIKSFADSFDVHGCTNRHVKGWETALCHVPGRDTILVFRDDYLVGYSVLGTDNYHQNSSCVVLDFRACDETVASELLRCICSKFSRHASIHWKGNTTHAELMLGDQILFRSDRHQTKHVVMYHPINFLEHVNMHLKCTGFQIVWQQIPNSGVASLVMEPHHSRGTISAIKGSDKPVVMLLSTLLRLYTGYTSVFDEVLSGNITESRTDVITALDSAFPKQPIFLSPLDMS